MMNTKVDGTFTALKLAIDSLATDPGPMPVICVPRCPLRSLLLGSFITLVYNVKLHHNSITVENVLRQCIFVAFCHAEVNAT